MEKVKSPWIINNFFDGPEYNKIMSRINMLDINEWTFEDLHNRYVYYSEILSRISLTKLDRARKEFNNDSIIYTYSLLALYNQKKSRLIPHKDDNACQYTFDICLYSKYPWPIVVEDKEYILENNQALCFYGEDQLHYRPEFNPDNKVLMLFMHWADPSHWFFTDYEGI